MLRQVYLEPANDRISGATKTLKVEEQKQTSNYLLSWGWRSDSPFELMVAGTATPTVVPSIPWALSLPPAHAVSEAELQHAQAARAAVLSGFIQVTVSPDVAGLRGQMLTIPRRGFILVTSENMEMGVIPSRFGPAIAINDEAKSMIGKEHLETVMAAVEASITELGREGAHIREVVVERETDPEIEAREVLAVTVWMRDASPEDASSFWRLLHERIKLHKAALPREEREKLDKWVSVGVDLE